jgi:hypothetical protein
MDPAPGTGVEESKIPTDVFVETDADDRTVPSIAEASECPPEHSVAFMDALVCDDYEEQRDNSWWGFYKEAMREAHERIHNEVKAHAHYSRIQEMLKSAGDLTSLVEPAKVRTAVDHLRIAQELNAKGWPEFNRHWHRGQATPADEVVEVCQLDAPPDEEVEVTIGTQHRSPTGVMGRVAMLQDLSQRRGTVTESELAAIADKNPEWEDVSQVTEAITSKDDEAWVFDHKLERGDRIDQIVVGYRKIPAFLTWNDKVLRSTAQVFGSQRGLTFLQAVSCQGRWDPRAVDVARDLVSRDIGTVPAGMLANVRVALGAYWRQSGQETPTNLSGAEKAQVDAYIDLLDALRLRRPVVGCIDAVLHRGPYTALADAMAAAEADGNARWLTANGVLRDGPTRGHFASENSVPNPPTLPTNRQEIDVELGNVRLTSVFADSLPHTVLMVHGRFGQEPLISDYAGPRGTWTLTHGGRRWVSEGSHKVQTVEALTQGNPRQVLMYEPSNKLVEAVIKRFWETGVNVAIIIVKPTGEILERMQRKHNDMLAKQQREAEGRDGPSGGRSGPGGSPSGRGSGGRGGDTGASTGGGVQSFSCSAAPKQDIDGAMALGEELLEDCVDQGWLDPVEAAISASVFFELTKDARTRGEYIRMVEIAQALITVVDGLMCWNPGRNDDIREAIARGGTTAHLDSPQLSDHWADTETPYPREHIREPLSGQWRDQFLRNHDYWWKVGYANGLRTILDDEDATVTMASRICAKTGDCTPLEYVLQQLPNLFRGCGSGHCWCKDSLPSAHDYSRSTGAATLPSYGRMRCSKNLRFGTKPWQQLAVWKYGHVPSSPWAELLQVPACVSVDSLRQIVDEVAMDAPPPTDWPEPMENMQLGGMPINCTEAMGRHAVKERGLGKWKLGCNAAPQMKCAFLVWLSSLSEEVRLELERYDLHLMTLKQWLDWDSQVSIMIRRAAMVGRLKGEAWLQLRKVGAVCARHATRADFESEIRERTVLPVLKWCWAADYREEYILRANIIGAHAANACRKRGDHSTLDEHWEMRAVRAPSGTSSCSRWVKEMNRGSPRAAPSDRPSKKAALSSMPRAWLDNGLRLLPIHLGRLSTKPEPKNRARTLGATGDFTTTIADHGLRGSEGSGNYGGMAATQRPDVIGRWLESASDVTGWMWSADLDNQNWQHELWEMQAMWLGQADGFRKWPDQASQERADSCEFIANGFNRTVALVEGGLHRLYTSMYSGQRGTTWNNTESHDIDREIAVKMVRSMDLATTHYGVSESGDDEHLRTATWLEGAAYIQSQRLMGVRMNAKKQLVGRRHGEYLQRSISEDAAPKQSAASIIVTLCTGNWYRPGGTWMNSSLDTTCTNWLEACSRGVPRTVCARMCAMTLDQVMRDMWDTKQPLSWRQFALSNNAGAVLFQDCPGYGNKTPPDLVVRGKPRGNWTSHGVSDYLYSKEGRWLSSLLDKEWMRKQWQDSVAFDAHASCEMGAIRDETSREVCKRWPKGSDFVEIPPHLVELRPAPGLRDTVTAWLAAKKSGRAITEEDNLAALGLGNRETTLLGGYDNIVKNLSPERKGRLRNIRAGPQVELDVALDGGVRAGLAMHVQPNPRFGLVDSGRPQDRTVVVVAATHGSGMSQIARRFRQNTAVRFDRLCSTWCGNLAYNRNYDGSMATTESTRHCARIIAGRLREGWKPGVRVLLTHEHPDIIVDVLRGAGLRSYWYLYAPDEGERMARVYMRQVAPEILRYMQSTWRTLYRLQGAADELHTQEEVIQVARCTPIYACA